MFDNNDPHVLVSNIIYGPVVSKRHGRSLGINVGVPDKKICTWSCLYCQCGFGERRDFLATDDRYDSKIILSTVKQYLKKDTSVSVITIAGNTEPGTHLEIYSIIDGLLKLRKDIKQEWKINILSNGSELDRVDVVEAFNFADEVWVKLDVSSEVKFKTLNRPISKVGSLSDHINRLKKLDNLRLQTFLWSHVSNSMLANFDLDNLAGLSNIYQELKPIAVHVTTISRLPAFSELVAADFQSKLFLDFINKTQLSGINIQYFQ